MRLRALFPRPDLILFGFILGVAAAVVGQGAYHEIRGLVHLNLWERWFAERHHDRVAEILRSEVATATVAVRDGETLPISGFLAEELMGRLYEHHMAWACALLRAGEVGRFNELRHTTPFLLFDAAAVLGLVDSRIVAGFRAQIEQEPAIPQEPRRPALLSMVRDYYLQ